MRGKNAQIYGGLIPRKSIKSRDFNDTLLPNLPTQNCLPSSYHHTLGREKLLILPGSIFSEICFPQQQKGVKEILTCFVKIQSENMKMTWKIRFFIFTVL